MSTIVSAVDARKHLGHLLKIVEITGDDVIIERSGKKVARIVRYEEPAYEGETKRLMLHDAQGLGKELWKNVNIEDYLKKEREEWE